MARGRREHEDEESEAGEDEGEAGGDVAVQLEVLVHIEGDPHARQEKDGSGRLMREREFRCLDWTRTERVNRLRQQNSF